MSKYQDSLDFLALLSSRLLENQKLEDSAFMESYNKSKNFLQELVDKAIPEKPITIKPEGTGIFDYPTDRIKCPNCNIQLPMKKNCLKKKVPITYCDRCGQKLDWMD